MANEQVNVPSLVVILVVSGLIIRFLFFSSASTTASSSGNASQRTAAASTAAARSREAAAERILQMFPQVDRRTVLWDLQRNGGSIAATTERILAGRMETVGLSHPSSGVAGMARGKSSC
jgi:coupling of ubiquitin conjugation to ER degradation protein 1